MTRLSTYFWPTLKDAPADAEALSHKLMVRAGLIRQLSAGMWTFLPAGLKVQKRAEQIIREEMEAIGGQEVLMPVIQPAEIWKKTGRYEIDEMFKLTDRKGTEMVLAMTHEENLTYHVAREVRSYRDLPLILWQLQIKERDEPRPRAGLLRTREFTMKDSYSFDRDEAGLQASYDKHITAYDRIFDRAGLRWYRVESDVGMMGGSGAHEYMAPCPAGENEVALAPGYAANVEVATAEPKPIEMPPALEAPTEVPTPGMTTVSDVAGALGVDPGALIKAMPVVVEGRGLVLALIRGDHRLNELKLDNAMGAKTRPASPEEIEAEIGPVGFIGPVGVDLPVFRDRAVSGHGLVCGANKSDHHLIGIDPARDFESVEVDIRSVEPGDTAPGGGEITIEPAIEIGNIFKLGTRYSEALGATYLDEGGTEKPIVMGSYGIGPARIVAAAIEQSADSKGIVWPGSLAPWMVQVVSLARDPDDEVAVAAADVYEQLRAAGIEAVLDDRSGGAGEKLTDAELIGAPLRVVIGKRGLGEGKAETQTRHDSADGNIAIEEIVAGVSAILEGLPSGPPASPGEAGGS